MSDQTCPICKKGKMRPLSKAGTDGDIEPPFSKRSDSRSYECDNDDCRQRLSHEQLMEKSVPSSDSVSWEKKKANETKS